MKNTEFMLRKVPLETFIEILIELYNTGANFVDITGKLDGQEEVVAISVLQEYMESETNELSEDDLTNLIG